MFERTLFWSLLVLISAYLLRKFYFTASGEKISRLRYAAIFINATVLTLFFSTWIPLSLSRAQETGFALMLQGNIDVIAVFVLVASSLIFLIANKTAFLRISAIFNITASVIFIGALLRLFPETYTMRLSESSPIFIILLLLAGNVVALLLWHQLQLREGKKINVWGGKKLAIWLPIFLIIVFGYWYVSSQLGKQAAVVYESGRHGYSISIPRSWHIDDSQKDQPADFISSPDKTVLIFIQLLSTPEDVSEEEVKGAIREELERSPAHTVEILQEREWKGAKTIYAEGLYDGGNGPWPGTYRFYEYNSFLLDRSVFTLRVNVLESDIAVFESIIPTIVDSVILPDRPF